MNQTYLAKLLWNIWMSLTVTFCCLKMVAGHPSLPADPQEMYPIFGGPQHTTTAIPRRKVSRFWGPTRASFTIWMYSHEAFSMVGRLWKWGVLESPVCSWCIADIQTSLHLLRITGDPRLFRIHYYQMLSGQNFSAGADIIW